MIGFDNVTSNVNASLELGNYAGFSWVNFDALRQDYLQASGIPSGLDNGVLSPQYAGVNHREGYAIIQSAQPFDFLGGDFTSLGKNNARITVEGYLAGDPLGGVSTLGTPTFTYSTMFLAKGPAHIDVNFTNVVNVKVLAFRWYDSGTTTAAYPGNVTYGDFFVLDNMLVSVPEPGSVILLLTSLFCGVGIQRFRKS